MGNDCMRGWGGARLFGMARSRRGATAAAATPGVDYVKLADVMQRLNTGIKDKRAKADGYRQRARELRKGKTDAQKTDLQRNVQMFTLLYQQASEMEAQFITLDTLFETMSHAKLTKQSMVTLREQLDALRQSSETFKSSDAEKLMDELSTALDMTQETIAVVSGDVQTAATLPVRERTLDALLADSDEDESSIEEQRATAHASRMRTVKLDGSDDDDDRVLVSLAV